MAETAKKAVKRNTDVVENTPTNQTEKLKANMINLANSLIRRVEAKEITGSEYISKIVDIYNAVK